jgi:uncharacterized membrane protein
MVDVERSVSQGQCRFVLRPNRSMSWQGSLIFFFSLMVLSSFIAFVLTMQGFWMVLPFTGLEILTVGVGLYLVACRCYECEVISIAENSILIEKGRSYPQQRWRLGRVWARVVLEPCPKQWYPSRLLIRSHGQAVEVGQFLHEEERQHLAAELNRSL